MDHEDSLAREGSAVSCRAASGGHVGSKLIRCCWNGGRVTRWNVRRPRWKGNRKGTIPFDRARCCVQESTHVPRSIDPAFTFVHRVHRCHRLVGSWASFFLPLWEKTLFVNQHRNHNSLDWFDFLLDKEILFRNRLIRNIFASIFLHRFFLFYSLSVVIITP